jgi:hypothetical protein
MREIFYYGLVVRMFESVLVCSRFLSLSLSLVSEKQKFFNTQQKDLYIDRIVE